jgi:hypothetical protein
MRENADQRAQLSRLETPSSSGAGATGASGAAKALPATKPAGVSNNQRRAWEKERDQAEADITRLERRQAELGQELSDPAVYGDKPRAQKLAQEQSDVAQSLNARLSRWEELCSLLA